MGPITNYNFDSVLSYNNTNYETCNCVFNKHKMTRTDISNFVNSKINTTIAKLNFCFGTSAYIIHPNGAKKLKISIFLVWRNKKTILRNIYFL